MLEESEPTTSPESTSSAVDSPAKTSAVLEEELALLVLEAAFGTSSRASSGRLARTGSLSKTLPGAPSAGLMQSETTWESSAMRAYRSRLQRAMLELRTDAAESSLLPTPTASQFDSNRGGAQGRVGKIRYSLAGLAKRGLLIGHPKGPLQPAFVEWMMRFPIGWTDLER